MSSTIWLKFKDSKLDNELTLEDDYIKFTSAMPSLDKVCADNNVIDINEFVDYTESMSAFEDEIPEDLKDKEFQFKKITELVQTLNVLLYNVDDDISSDINNIIEKCNIHNKDYDLVSLNYIM